MARITLDGGVQVRTFSPPPRGFDAMTASPADLLKHGFPARPDHIPHLKLYEKMFSQMRGRFRYVEPAFKVNAHRRTATSKRLPPKRTDVKPLIQASSNWAGSVVFSPPMQSIHWVTGSWTIPNISVGLDDKQYSCVIGLGIDGDYGYSSSQEPLLFGVRLDTTNQSPICQLWFQWPQGSVLTISNFAVTVGDSVAATICTAGAGATEATMFIANVTAGHGTSFSMSGSSLLGDCAEWVVELPENVLLANFTNVFFWDCIAVSYLPDGTIGADLYGGTESNLVMTPDATDLSKALATGTLVSDTVVQCSFNKSAN